MIVLISGGNSDSTTMPTSQNQLVTIAPHHNLASARRCRIIAAVEAAMLVAILSCGAPSPVGGINSADVQHAAAKLMISAANSPGLATIARGQSARNRAQKNGDKRGAFHQRVGGGQLLAPQMIRKNAVFYWAKKRRENTEAEQCGEQKRERTPHIRPRRQSGHKDLHEFEPLRNPCLVVAICKFASERGQKKIGRNEHRARDRDQSLGIARTRLKQDDKDQRGLEKIIVECREELAPEQRRKSPRQQKGRWHAETLLQSSHDCSMIALARVQKNWAAFRPPHSCT